MPPHSYWRHLNGQPRAGVKAICSSTAPVPAPALHIHGTGAPHAVNGPHTGVMSPRISAPKTSIATILAGLGNTARRKTLLARGATDWQLRQAVDSGAVTQLAPGLYALPGISAMDAHLALNQATPTCLSRAHDLGLWVLQPPGQPHVATAHGRAVPGCVVHRVQGPPTLWDVLRQCVQCGSELVALCVVESAVVQKKCTITELRRVFTRVKDARARGIIDMVDPQSMSSAETCARYHLRPVPSAPGRLQRPMPSESTGCGSSGCSH